MAPAIATVMTRAFSERAVTFEIIERDETSGVLIDEISEQESLSLLARARLGRLACAHGLQPYIVPFYFAYHHNYIYSFSTLGQKIDWMRANPLVCVEVDEVMSPCEWESVIVFGEYEELEDAPESRVDREFAYKLLGQRAKWWEPGYAKTILHGKERPLEPIFYRIYVVRVTGRRAILEPTAAPDPDLSMTDVGVGRGLQKVLRLIQVKRKGSSR
jgi:nitroimidazol reductase NimA-like FMN-containing flavoprotein (pyridoxamine 5'-phosphate oxidase superfamily)